MNIKQYVIDNNLNVEWLLSDRVLSINQINYCVVSDKEIMIDESFEIVLDDEDVHLIEEYNCHNIIFELGEWWFYSSIERTQLIPFKYIHQASQSTPYVHLGIHGMYEICNGSRSYKDWCKKAKFLNISTLGICEYNSLAGTLQFQQDCKDNGIKSILGITVVVKNSTNHTYLVKLFAKNDKGWNNILKVNKAVNVDNEGFIYETDLFQYLHNVYVIHQEYNQHTSKVLSHYRECCDTDSVFFQIDPVQWKSDDRDKKHLENIKAIVDSDLPGIILADSYYLDKTDSRVKELLNKIGKLNRENQSIDQWFKTREEITSSLLSLFTDLNKGQSLIDVWFNNAVCIEQGCDFRIPTGIFHLPEYKLSKIEDLLHGDKYTLFFNLIEEGMRKKIIDKQIDPTPYYERIDEEFGVIDKGGFVDYFLILSDIINWSKENGILTGIGRGSAGGSLIAFLLGITRVDPIKYDLLFSRFLNEGRIGRGLPDIDTDFSGERRDEVKRYMEQRYGIDNVCSIGTYGTFKTKAAIRDLSRFSNVSLQTVNYFAAMIEESNSSYEDIFKQAVANKRFKEFVQESYDTINDLPLILGQPKTCSIHAAGVIITPDQRDSQPCTIFDWIPVKKMDGVLVSEWEGPQIETAGFLKEDILGIKQLDKFSEIFKLIKANGGQVPDLDNIQTDDPDVYELFCQGLNQDLFHFGSVGLTNYSQSVKPRNIEELIAMIAVYRPGAMEYGAHDDYVKIKMGKKEPQYDHPIVAEVTKPTLSLMIYQEQAMKICQVLAGFSPVEADDVRKYIGKKQMDKLKIVKDKFIKGAAKNDCSPDIAEKIWNKIEAFGGYAFNKSHSAAYALTGYFCQWLKWHYPIEFWTVSLQFAEEKDIPSRINEISRLQNIKILSPDINKSQMAFSSSVEENAIYWSIGKIRNVGEVALAAIVNDRNSNGKYFSIEEFYGRMDKRKVNKTCIVNLILAGCFDQVEGIEKVQQRKDLLIKFFELIKQPLPEIYSQPQVKHEWFWFLEQKRVSGSGILDYTTLFDQFTQIDSIERYHCPPQKILLDENVNCEAVLVGIVVDVIEKKSKKGLFAQVIIEHNNALGEVTLWNESWEIYKNDLIENIGRIAAINGTIVADKWKQHNIIHSHINTKVQII